MFRESDLQKLMDVKAEKNRLTEKRNKLKTLSGVVYSLQWHVAKQPREADSFSLELYEIQAIIRAIDEQITRLDGILEELGVKVGF